MRILHLSALYPPILHGGAERFAATLAEEQARQGHDVGVVTLAPDAAQPVHEQNGVLVHRIKHGNLFWGLDWEKYPSPLRYANKFFHGWNPIIRSRVGAAIDSFRPDVVNSHCMVGFSVDSWTAAAERNVPIVHALHELNLFCRNTNAFRDGKMCEGICVACRITEPRRWLSRQVSSVVGVSHDVLQRHLDRGFFGHIPPERRSIIWSMPPITVGSRRTRLKDAPFTIGFIGRILQEKGIENLLDAVAGLRNQEGWRLLIAGEVLPPLDEAELRAKTAGLPVEWLGFAKSSEFYPMIDLLVVPAIWADPGPLVVHEAFLNGVPIVGARIGGIADFIEPGVTGWLYAPHDVTALRAILAERIREGRAALPTEPDFAKFRAETTRQRVAERYIDVYQKTINAFGARPSPSATPARHALTRA
jgi:glycosyltransferase involved in cell wall biosynthesis